VEDVVGLLVEAGGLLRRVRAHDRGRLTRTRLTVMSFHAMSTVREMSMTAEVCVM
jgi:hypothetical protein